VISEAQFSELLLVLNKAVAHVPAENRMLAKQCVADFVEILQPYSSNINKIVLESFPQVKNALQITTDLYRLYALDSAGFIEFLGDALASRMSLDDLQRLRDWPRASTRIVDWLFKLQAATPPERASILPQVPEGFLRAVEGLISGEGLSLTLLKGTLIGVGIPIGGKPGRPREDYSAESELKKKHSWTEVARISLKERLESQQEFGTDDFDSLTLEKQNLLRSRIRQGVREHERRLKASSPTKKRNMEENPLNSPMQSIPADKLPS
jgi:hypothetical protein